MTPTTHPCGSLPVTGWTLSTWFCHHHMAYWLSVQRYTQATDSTFTYDATERREFGPFDTWEDVAEAAWDFLPIDGLAPSPLA